MILCCGEMLIDMLPETNSKGQKTFLPCAGGAVFNTSIALGRLGTPVGLFSGLSSDLFGDLLRKALDQSSVDYQYSVKSSLLTMLAFVSLKNGQAEYSFYDENTAARMISEADLPEFNPMQSKQINTLFFGAISLVQEPCASSYEKLAQREYKNRVIMLDPNIRPAFIQSEEAYRQRLNRLFCIADIVKVSDEDLKWIYQTDDIDTGIKSLKNCGASIILLTKGAEGATAITQNSVIDLPSQKAKIVDTVGAGDAFNAGVLASLHEQKLLDKNALKNITNAQLTKAMELGISVAAITVSRTGANPPWRSELNL